jgi:hypothetical protein
MIHKIVLLPLIAYGVFAAPLGLVQWPTGSCQTAFAATSYQSSSRNCSVSRAWAAASDW